MAVDKDGNEIKEEVIEKTAAEVAKEKVDAERAGIDVEVSKQLEDEEEIKNEENDEEETEEEGEEKNDGEKELTADEIKAVEKTEAEAKEQRKNERIERKFQKEVAEKKALKLELETLRKKLEADPEKNKLSADDIETEAQRIAEERLVQRAFQDDQTKVVKAAEKIDKDFVKNLKTAAEDTGKIVPGEMIGMLAELDNPGEVFAALVKDVDLFDELVSLPMNKMAMKLGKLSDKLIKEAAPKPKPISKVPDPAAPIKGNTRTPNNEPNDKDDMETWLAKRNAQVAKRNEEKRNGIRH